MERGDREVEGAGNLLVGGASPGDEDDVEAGEADDGDHEQGHETHDHLPRTRRDAP